MHIKHDHLLLNDSFILIRSGYMHHQSWMSHLVPNHLRCLWTRYAWDLASKTFYSSEFRTEGSITLRYRLIGCLVLTVSHTPRYLSIHLVVFKVLLARAICELRDRFLLK